VIVVYRPFSRAGLVRASCVSRGRGELRVLKERRVFSARQLPWEWQDVYSRR
jgi:hypothetical protein